MACSCGGRNKTASSWRHIAPDGATTDKKQKYEVEWLLRKHGGSIEQVRT